MAHHAGLISHDSQKKLMILPVSRDKVVFRRKKHAILRIYLVLNLMVAKFKVVGKIHFGGS